jgi:hypothetical protein
MEDQIDDGTKKESVPRIDIVAEFRKATKESRIAMAKEFFAADSIGFLSEALKIQLPKTQFLELPKEVVEMDDILTHQMMSTYRHDIMPLGILSKGK